MSPQKLLECCESPLRVSQEKLKSPSISASRFSDKEQSTSETWVWSSLLAEGGMYRPQTIKNLLEWI